MNGDPYRTPQPSDRRVINRSASAPAAASQSARQAEEPQPKSRSQKATAPAAQAGGEKSHKRKSLVTTIVAILAVALVVLGGYIVFSKMQSGAPGIDSTKYQAVSLSDGQLYFGKLSSIDSSHLKLTDVYYLQPQTGESSNSSSLQNSTSGQSNFKLIKFTDVIYGPEDEMIITKSQVLFYENIDSDGKVAELIRQQKDSK